MVDRGQDEDHVAPLDFQPEYNIQAIDKKISMYSFRVLTWSVGVLGLVMLTVKWSAAQGTVIWLLNLILAFVGLMFVVSDALHLVFWWRQRWQSLRGGDQLPDGNDPNVESLNWWQLYRAGFHPAAIVGGIRDDDLQLAGQPFKLLQKGEHCIPVFLRRGESRRLFPQHYVRIAAYCLLLQRQTGMRAPYGIILYAGTFECVAIKFNRESFDLLSQRFLDARRILREHTQLEQSPRKPQSALCRQCPFGKPLLVESSKSLLLREQSGLTPRAHIAKDGRRYHCHCGDRFKWVPPHERMVQLGIPN